MNMKYILSSTVAGIAMLAVTSTNADNLEKLGKFQTTGTTEFTTIEQGGANAEAIRNTLKRIKMPSGFKIDLYAIVPDAVDMPLRREPVWSSCLKYK